jgi:hypothetical protein
MNNVFKNEALCLLSIHNFISEFGPLDLEKVYLVSPLLFDKKVRNYFKRRTTKIISAQDLVTSRPDFFIGFNEKYKDLLITTTNSVLMAIELGILKLDGGLLKSTAPVSESPSSISKMFSEIALATPNTIRFIKEPSTTLFSLLRIEI